MNPDGSGQTLILELSENATYGQPQFLPDGRIICMRNGDSQDIVLVNADGSGLVNLTPDTDDSDEFFPSVNSDGTKIAFATNRNSQRDIYIGTLSGTTLSNLVNITADTDTDCWRPLFGVVDRSYITP
jgi:Tol biopolymer transport system component